LIAIEDKKLRNRIVLLNSIRIAILSVLIVVSGIILFFFYSPFPILPIILSLAAALLVSVFYFPLNRILRYQSLIYLQLILDIVVITILVYFSGGIVSPFYFLYILPIIVSSIFLDRRDTVYIATFSFIIFGILSDLLYLKLIPFSTGSYENISLGTFIYNLLMSFISFSSVSIISSYYFVRIRKTGEELRNVQENLQDMIMLNNSVMERMENGFLTCDDSGRVISFNQKAASLLKVNTTSNVFTRLLSAADQRAVLGITSQNNRYYFERTVGSYDLGVSVSVIENIHHFDRIYAFLITDLTEMKTIEKKLKEREHLALIGEMAAGIAHEIRNPLASISGSVQFLKKEVSLSPEYQNLMGIIVKESARLSKSVDEFLNFARTTPLNKTRFDLSDTLSGIVDLLQRQYKRVQFEKKFGPGHWLSADSEKIRQMVWNLLNNAVKAVRETGTVEIIIFTEGQRTCLAIRDNGIGMGKDELARVFTPFYSKFPTGIGLGMAIVRRIVSEHGFDIRIKSEKNVGTEVTICFKAP